MTANETCQPNKKRSKIISLSPAEYNYVDGCKTNTSKEKMLAQENVSEIILQPPAEFNDQRSESKISITPIKTIYGQLKNVIFENEYCLKYLILASIDDLKR